MSNEDCLFCRIVRREIPADVVFEDQEFLGFKDIHPKAPVHVLVIPKRHTLASVAEMRGTRSPEVGGMVDTARRIAEKLGIERLGYRLIFNVRHHGGQEVDHIHLHLLGGEPLGPIRS